MRLNIDCPLYLISTLTHVVDNSHDLVRPRGDICGAIVPIKAVATVHRAKGIDSVEDPDAVPVAVSYH